MDEGSRDCGGFVCERDGDGRGAADPEGTEQGGMIKRMMLERTGMNVIKRKAVRKSGLRCVNLL